MVDFWGIFDLLELPDEQRLEELEALKEYDLDDDIDDELPEIDLTHD